MSPNLFYIFFFNDTATTEIYTLSLHDALPIFFHEPSGDTFPSACAEFQRQCFPLGTRLRQHQCADPANRVHELRSEEHTSELQSRLHLVCRLLLEKKKKNHQYHSFIEERD